jgi:hypothetical protein
MVVAGTQMRHLIVLPKRDGQSTARGGWKGLNRGLLAVALSTFWVVSKHDAGLTEETNKMIEEEAQNCRLIEKRKEFDDKLQKTDSIRT